MELLEREDERAALETALAASREAGRVVVVAGEAGIGKTALVSAVCAGLGTRRVLWGGCDPLVTPRALGPFRDVAGELGADVPGLIDDAAGSRERLLGAVLGALGGGPVLVVEDVHWADDASLDLLTLIVRRLARARGCLVLTCRTDALRDRPAVRRVLTGAPREALCRIDLAPLSPDAVALLARRAGREDADLHAISQGNPFFVTEALAADGLPATVRDAIADRVAALGPAARALVERAAVVPGPAELWLLDAEPEVLDACVDAGLLTVSGDAVAFRHELARRAVLDDIPPIRCRAQDTAVLAALEARGHADPARLAHHARFAEDTAGIRRHAPVAARAASAAGGHTQALAHWEAALAACPAEDAAERTTALEGVALEAYLCGEPVRALEAREALREHHAATGDDRGVGDDLRWISRLRWWAGDGAGAAESGDAAIAVLERDGESRELAGALSGRSQLAMLADDGELAIDLARRATAIGQRLGDDETIANALINHGTVLANSADDHEAGRALLEEAHALALRSGHDDPATRALVNLATTTLVNHRDDPRVGADLDRALDLARRRDLDGYVQYVLGVRSNLHLLHGDWASAEDDARASLDRGEQRGVSLCPALITLGKLRARRGDDDAGATLDEAWRVAVATGELQRLAPAAAARAEHAWLAGDAAGVAAVAHEPYRLALERGSPWAVGELALWLSRAGVLTTVPERVAAPYAAALAGDARAAAAAFTAIGFPYEAADVLADGDDADRLEALTTFDRLGAERAAARVRRRLRADGVRGVPRGPRRAARADPDGLTPRQAEVLELLAAGATNAEIAERLIISPKTVDHHVSAVLGKLGVTSRHDAARVAAR